MERLFKALFKTIISIFILMIIIKYGDNIVYFYEKHPWMLIATILFLYYYYFSK
jgi:hypothetical protein